MTNPRTAHPVDGIMVDLDGVQYVAGDALFTHWISRTTGQQVTDLTLADTLDRLLLTARRNAR